MKEKVAHNFMIPGVLTRILHIILFNFLKIRWEVLLGDKYFECFYLIKNAVL